MKKKLLMLLLIAVTAVCLVLGISACSDGGGCDAFSSCDAFSGCDAFSSCNPDQNDPEGNEPGGEQGDLEQGDNDPEGIEPGGNDPTTEPEPEPEYTEGLEYELSDDCTYYIVTGIGTATKETKIIIPTEHNGKPVKEISDYTFRGCDSFESVTIGNGVTSIGKYAFSGCSSLARIAIPNSVTSIGAYAFFRCNSLANLTIPNSVTSIGVVAFYDCDSLESITVESGNSVYHSQGNCLIETASKTLIAGCKNSVIPANGSVTSIGDGAFGGCSSLESITIPDSVTHIGVSAFHSCRSLTSVTIGNGVTTIGRYAFDNCGSLEFNEYDNALYLGNNENPYVVLIDTKNAYITSCNINENTKVIAVGAFRGCDSLVSINIPNSVTSIGDAAFYSCSSLESITVESGNTVFHSQGNCLIETASKTLIAGCKNSIIPVDGSVTSIGVDAFGGCDSLESITIPDSVTYIGEDAFDYCSSLTNITIPNSVTSIGGDAFYGCDSLETVYYTGSKAQWNSIDIGNYNSYLINANIVFNYKG